MSIITIGYWIYEHYLSCRRHIAIIPQECILVQLLFTLSVYHLPQVAENYITNMYIDDTELEHQVKPQEIQL